jgi:TonB family protein
MVGSTFKLSYAVAALAVLPGGSFMRAKADDAPAASSPSCEIGEPLNRLALSPEQLVASGAMFMKLCRESGGAIVNGDDSRLVHDLTLPGKIMGPGSRDFYPPISARHGEQGTILVSFVVETDARTSSAVVLESSRNARLDKAALEFVASLTFKSPAYRGFTPVRMYSVLRVDFHS